MEEEKQDVNNQEPIQPEDVETEESSTSEPVQTQETETATPQEAVTPEEEQRVPYDRFKTVYDENKWLRELVARQVPPPQQQPTTDPYAGATAEEKIFYQQRDARIKEIVKEENKAVREQITMGRREIARLMHSQFRTNHPDIKANSEEERQIAQKITQGYPADDAYKLVMWDKKVGEKTMLTKQQQQQRIDAKRQANVVSSSSNSPQSLPKGKESFEDEMKRKMENDWDGTI